VSQNKSVSARLLRSCHEKAGQKWEKGAKARLADLRALLPKAVAKDATFVQGLHKQLESKIAEDIRASLDSHLDDWALEAKLGELDDIVAKAERAVAEGSKENVKAWRPSGDALNDQAAHDSAALSAAVTDVSGEGLAQAERKAEALAADVQRLRDQIQANEKEVEDALRDH